MSVTRKVPRMSAEVVSQVVKSCVVDKLAAKSRDNELHKPSFMTSGFEPAQASYASEMSL